jgi:cell shape-determining protein MreD
LWNGLLVLAPAWLAVMLLATPVFSGRQLPAMTGTLLGGLLLYCVLFAVNSSVHSFLIVKYADGDKVAMNVG